MGLVLYVYCVSVSLSGSLVVWLSMQLPACLSVYPSVCMSGCLCLSVCLPVCFFPSAPEASNRLGFHPIAECSGCDRKFINNRGIGERERPGADAITEDARDAAN